MTSATPLPGPVVSRTPWSRRALGGLLACVPAVLMVTWGHAQLAVLPELVPTHFGASGLADAWSGRDGTWIAMTIVAAVCALGALAGIWVPGAFARVWLQVGLGWFGAFMAGIWWGTVVVTRDAPSPDEQRLTWQLAVIIGAGLVWAALVWIAHGRVRRAPTEPAAARGALLLAPGERVAARAVVSSPLMWWLGLVVAVVAVAVTIAMALTEQGAGAWVLGGVLFASALAVLVLGHVQVTADARGLRVTSWTGLPIKRISLPDIEQVRAEVIEPLEWGGWGYRVQPGKSAYVVRRGPGVAVRLTSGREFAVTTESADELVGVLLALRAREPEPGP